MKLQEVVGRRDLVLGEPGVPGTKAALLRCSRFLGTGAWHEVL